MKNILLILSLMITYSTSVVAATGEEKNGVVPLICKVQAGGVTTYNNDGNASVIVRLKSCTKSEDPDFPDDANFYDKKLVKLNPIQSKYGVHTLVTVLRNKKEISIGANVSSHNSDFITVRWFTVSSVEKR